jgi:hypothetical protein
LNDTDKKNFVTIMNIVQSNYGRKPLDKDALRYWFGKLEKFSLEDVSKAFDRWIDSQDDLPTVHNILELLRPAVTIHQRLASPLRIEDNKKHVAELKEGIDKMTSPRRDMKDWARKILASPSNYPDISVRFAKEALSVNTD